MRGLWVNELYINLIRWTCILHHVPSIKRRDFGLTTSTKMDCLKPVDRRRWWNTISHLHFLGSFIPNHVSISNIESVTRFWEALFYSFRLSSASRSLELADCKTASFSWIKLNASDECTIYSESLMALHVKYPATGLNKEWMNEQSNRIDGSRANKYNARFTAFRIAFHNCNAFREVRAIDYESQSVWLE